MLFIGCALPRNILHIILGVAVKSYITEPSERLQEPVATPIKRQPPGIDRLIIVRHNV
jgi:hypothetical protein